MVFGQNTKSKINERKNRLDLIKRKKKKNSALWKTFLFIYFFGLIHGTWKSPGQETAVAMQDP